MKDEDVREMRIGYKRVLKKYDIMFDALLNIACSSNASELTCKEMAKEALREVSKQEGRGER